jgi:CARDB
VTSIVLPASIQLIDGVATYDAQVTVKNQGTAAADGGYLSIWPNNPEQACGAPWYLRQSVGTLAVNGSKTLTFYGVKTYAAGPRTLRAFVDSFCTTAESDETNNQVAQTYTVTEPGTQPDAVGTFRPSDGAFYLDYNGNGAWDGCGTDRCLQLGLKGDIPLVGKW